MRAMAVTDYGRPLELLDLSLPRPGPGEALVRILYCGVCYTDVKTVTGHMPYSATLRLPHVAGHEISGEVAAVGAGATLREGTRVVVFNYWACGACRLCRAGRENLCLDLRGWVGFTTPGGFQEYLVVPEAALLPLPDGIPSDAAAAISCAIGTSYRAVVTRGATAPGETVFVIGSGGVGLHTVQIARAAGARVLVADVDERKLARAREFGAEAPPDLGRAAEWVLDATGGAGADVVVDTAGREESLRLGSRVVARGGRVVLVGYVVGERHTFPSAEAVLEEVSYLGSRYATRDEVARAIRLVAGGAVRPVVDAVFELEQANDALARVSGGDACGRIVLRVGRAARGS